MDDVELRTMGQTFQVGEDLYAVSVDQLTQRIAVLEAELARIRDALHKKSKDLTIAENIFKNA